MNRVDSAISFLLFKGQRVESRSWQAVRPLGGMIEVQDLFFKMPIYKTKDELAKVTKADLPWAEDHFQERLAGPTNPGKQYKNWPYYRPEDDDKRFRETGEFSHTYQERLWPPPVKGIRFVMGDYQNIRDRLRDNPTTRQAFLSIWHPEDQSNTLNRRLPCTIGYWFRRIGDTLNITYLIRSCDATRHFRNDVYMTQRLAIDMAEYIEADLGIMSMWIGSLHCFEGDRFFLQKKLKR